MAPRSTPKNKTAELELTRHMHMHVKLEMNRGCCLEENPSPFPRFLWLSHIFLPQGLCTRCSHRLLGPLSSPFFS